MHRGEGGSERDLEGWTATRSPRRAAAGFPHRPTLHLPMRATGRSQRGRRPVLQRGATAWETSSVVARSPCSVPDSLPHATAPASEARPGLAVRPSFDHSWLRRGKTRGACPRRSAFVARLYGEAGA